MDAATPVGPDPASAVDPFAVRPCVAAQPFVPRRPCVAAPPYVLGRPLAAGVRRPIRRAGRPFTRADLADIPDDGRRHELVDGVLVVSGAPGRLHQRAVGRLYRMLDDACPAEFEVIVAPFAVALAEDTEVQPDLLVARRADLTEAGLPAPPALSVEVLSDGSRLIDAHVKRERFERAGTGAYWVVDPAARPRAARLVVYELGADGRYWQVADVTGEQVLRVSLPYPIAITPADLVL